MKNLSFQVLHEDLSDLENTCGFPYENYGKLIFSFFCCKTVILLQNIKKKKTTLMDS